MKDQYFFFTNVHSVSKELQDIYCTILMQYYCRVDCSRTCGICGLWVWHWRSCTEPLMLFSYFYLLWISPSFIIILSDAFEEIVRILRNLPKTFPAPKECWPERSLRKYLESVHQNCGLLPKGSDFVILLLQVFSSWEDKQPDDIVLCPGQSCPLTSVAPVNHTMWLTQCQHCLPSCESFVIWRWFLPRLYKFLQCNGLESSTQSRQSSSFECYQIVTRKCT